MTSTEPLTIQTLWTDAKFSPNKEQEAAIRHLDGPLFLPAAPGSGKTRVLLWRTVNLIVFHKVSPEEIFLSTFTEKAARQLRDGLQNLLGIASNRTGTPYDISKLYVGTIHSLCRRIIADRRFSINRQRIRMPVLMDGLSQYLFLRRTQRWQALLDQSGLKTNERVNTLIDGKPSKSRHLAVSNLISFFNRLAEESLDLERVVKKTRDPDLKMLINATKIYRDMLENEGSVARVDLSLLQQRALDILAANPASGHAFKHVIIDEYQDTNPVQEKLFFALAEGHHNLCVVGDDDQALYRFRGATVENFVEFPARCEKRWGLQPKKLTLATNYRSRQRIVDFYGAHIEHSTCDWSKGKRGTEKYRVEKVIEAFRKDAQASVVASTPAAPEDVAEEIAETVAKLIKGKKVDDPCQIAFLFPSLKSTQVQRMREALEQKGLEVYAPRAGSFLEVDESIAMLGLFFHVFGVPDQGGYGGKDFTRYNDWATGAHDRALQIAKKDPLLTQFIISRCEELDAIQSDFAALEEVVTKNKWDLDAPYQPAIMKDKLLRAKDLTQRAQKSLSSALFEKAVLKRLEPGGRPFKLQYVINRATSVDWNVLDLFYHLCGFDVFRKAFDLAESGKDEGPICNLSLISQYLSCFVDEYGGIITGKRLRSGRFLGSLSGFLYALFRRGESEYEDAEDPFPKGRIPFITIHQAKGLQFPVVVLGNPRKDDKGPQSVESLVNPLLDRKGEPLERMSQFDIRRMFYVALSRAENLLIVAHFKGQGQRLSRPFDDLLADAKFPRLPKLDLKTIPVAKPEDDPLPRSYSYTADYMLYTRCPRQYMIFRKYGFVPSRSQTMFFGSLVHQTLEDLHQLLIGQRGVS